ncbi:MAG: hypothetical protein IT214_02300 [Chitinophagaceae bacterium]|jgi:hypothetical protein|nr:hypothetical protein [Chitinophagaceae bacterium]OQY93996.1 MAG: hypothetical protein B6D37_09680 [Sphingobacteriales bacterium UTBCD1]
MNARIDQLVQSVLHKKSLSECNVEELQKLAEQFPYSSAMQLLFTAKLKTVDPEKYKLQLQRASLFATNPLWLNYLMRDDSNYSEKPVPEKSEQEEQESTQTEQASPVLVPKLKDSDPENRNQEMIFEPYHTVDYFASQGVKIKAEDKPQDKFGQQLKSFTEWLKILRKVPATEISQTIDAGQEKKVEQLAAHSIEDRDVVTEAMAEVWEKQGNAVKAIEIYSKLGLLNPSKSSYFAAKIEHLKNWS